MKQILLVFIFLMLLFSGCQKIMHDQDTTITVINSAQQMDQAMIGVYGLLSLYIDNPAAPYPRIYSDDNAPEFNCSSWGVVPDRDSIAFQSIPFYVDLAPYYYLRWQAIYKIVISCNNIICQFENQKTIAREMQVGVGEAYLIRAYAYFNLVRIFGQVPIINNVTVNYTVGKSSFNDIYAFIVSDLKQAISLLPANRGVARIPSVSPTRGSAKAILAEVYLTMGGYPVKNATNYARAAEMAGEVIDSASFFGFNLLPDVADLWNGNQKINNETILGLYYNSHISQLNYSGGNQINNALAVYPTSSYPFSLWYYYVSPYIISGHNFFNNYPESYRKEATFQTFLPWIYIGDSSKSVVQFRNYTYADYTSLIFYKKFGYSCSAKDTEVVANLTSDYSSPYFTTYFHYSYDQPIYIFRYAHTLLTYAEAKARSGSLDEKAYEAINMVRRRANKLDVNSPSQFDVKSGLSANQFADSVVRERELELCGEMEGRWFDLVRLEMVEQLPALRDKASTAPPYAFTKEYYFAPIPDQELNFDPNLK
jgi:starch-binding outer membrane protein, SusD/RagB family